MPVIETSILIYQTPQVIEAAFLNPDNAVYWTTDLERFEVISRTPNLVGSVAHLHYKQGERRYILEDVMEDYVPGKYFKSRVTGGGLTAQVETWLQDQNGSTLVRMRWAGKGTTILIRLFLPLMRASIKKGMTAELEKFRGLLEKYGENFTKSNSPRS
jgi:hypothetical protein